MSLYILCFILFLLGFYCLLVKQNLIKKIIGFGIMEYAINLFFILLGYRWEGEAPILDKHQVIVNFVDCHRIGSYRIDGSDSHQDLRETQELRY